MTRPRTPRRSQGSVSLSVKGYHLSPTGEQKEEGEVGTHQTDRQAAPSPSSGVFMWSQVRQLSLAWPCLQPLDPVLTCQGV